jgi:hypothetical protein
MEVVSMKKAPDFHVCVRDVGLRLDYKWGSRGLVFGSHIEHLNVN